MDDCPQLHIYAQYCWHMDAAICGDVAGLTLLRDALNRALERGFARLPALENDAVFTADGEGYQVSIRLATAEQFGKLRLPYTSDSAADVRPHSDWDEFLHGAAAPA